jgi:hypothetical protein
MGSKMSDEMREVGELEPLELKARPDGPGAAAMLAAGIGILTLGVVTALSEASVAVHDWLETLDFGRGVGPLAGKTIVAAGTFFVAWLLLGLALRGREVRLAVWFWVALVMAVGGAVLLFPPVFTSFAAE